MVSKKRTVQHASRGFDAWYNHYDKVFGSRWSSTLYPSLLKKNRVIGFVNPFFTRFPFEPSLFHPRAEYCNDEELHHCIHVPISQQQAETTADRIGNLLHPAMLRMKRDVEAWLHDKEFKRADQMWYESVPDANCTYYEHVEKLPEFSTHLQHLKLHKLSWHDLDPYYLMDPASIRIARMVDTDEGSMFLDMCSAPGGKSLVLLDKILKCASNLERDHCKLVSNDMGFKRIKTLQQVIDSFIPKPMQSKHMMVTNVDAKLLGLAQPHKYDAVLLDAPCSGDRHLLKEKEEMTKWSIKSCKNVAKTQFGLLRSALETVKIGGYVVYSTCSMNEIENDQLIDQFMKKKRGKVQIVDNVKLNAGERTEYGWQILPDTSPFAEGPLFVCKLRRID